MKHSFLEFIAKLLVYMLVVLLPLLVVTYTDRFRRPLSPDNYAVLFAVVAAIGVLLFLPAISIVAAVALLALGIAWVYGRNALSGVEYERRLTPTRLFPGEDAELTLRITNRKLLPLAGLSLTDPVGIGLVRGGERLDDLLRFSGGIQLLESLGYALVNELAIGPLQSVTRTFRVHSIRRGVYPIGPCTAAAGDPFGIYGREATLGGRTEVVVYPRVYSPDEIGLPFREALGDATARRALVQDPIRIAGARGYQPGDPLKHMHWKATARTGELQVRIFDPSTTAQIIVVLNLNTFQHLWQGVDLDRMESTIEVAASLSLWALDRGFAVGLRSNGVVPGTELTPRVAASASPQQATILLEHLARITFSGRHSSEFILLDEARRLSSGSSIVFVTPIMTPEAIAVLTSRRLAGRISVVYCGRFAAPVIRGLPIFLATPPSQGVMHAVS